MATRKQRFLASQHGSSSRRREVGKVRLSKKKWQRLEKRIADLENKIQSQQKIETELVVQEIAERLEKAIQNCHY